MFANDEDDDGQDVPTFGDLHHKRYILHISGALEFVHVIWVTRFQANCYHMLLISL